MFLYFNKVKKMQISTHRLCILFHYTYVTFDQNNYSKIKINLKDLVWKLQDFKAHTFTVSYTRGVPTQWT